MPRRKNHPNDTYRIRFKGALNRSVTDWVGEVSLVPRKNGEMQVVAKFADQAALRGFLEQLWNLNCSILFLEKMDE